MILKPSLLALVLGGGGSYYYTTSAAPHGCIVKPKNELKPKKDKPATVNHIQDTGTGKQHGIKTAAAAAVETTSTLDMSDFDFHSCLAQQHVSEEIPFSSSMSMERGRVSPQEHQEKKSPTKKAKIGLQLLPEERSMEFEIEQVLVADDDKEIFQKKHPHKIVTGKMLSLVSEEQDVGELNVLLDAKGQMEVGSIHTHDAIYHLSKQEDGQTITTTKIFLKDLPQDDPQELRHSKELTRESFELDSQKVQRRNLRTSGATSESLLSPSELTITSSNTNDVLINQASSHRRRTQTSPYSTPYMDQSTLLQGVTEGWIIDVMVPYTQRTMCAIAQAGSPNNCLWNERRHDMVLKRIELAMAEANVAFINSGIPGRVRLVHTYMIESTDFDETNFSYTDILRALAYPTDGKMDNVTPLRDQYGADVVALFVDNQSSCGLAYTGAPVSKSWTFSVINWVCSTGYYSLVHEIGHHLGGRHDRRIEGCTGASNTQCCADLGGCDRYGYQDPLNRYRSIMSYACPIEGGCPRLQFFSQPSNPYRTSTGSEFPVGDVYHNNAKAITQNFRQVSAYRERPIKVTPAPVPAPVAAPVAVPVAAPVPAPVNYCGNGICEGHLGETCQTCPGDCISGRYKPSECGNGICEATENCLSCPKDCGGRLDVTLDAHKYCCVGGPRELVSSQNVKFGLSCKDHPYDYCLFNSKCSLEPETTSTFCCGNGICELGEGMWNCLTDCKCNNNNICDIWEDTSCGDCQGLNDIQDITYTKNCMSNGRNCVGIVPDPCCGKCNTLKRVCE